MLSRQGRTSSDEEKQKVKGAPARSRTAARPSLPRGAGEFLHDEVQQLLGGAEVTIRAEELLDVAFQRSTAGMGTKLRNNQYQLA